MMFESSWTFGVEASTRCKKCHFLLPLNGPVRSVVCAKCGERRDLPRATWDTLLDTPVKISRIMRPGSTSKTQIGIDSGALKLEITRENPFCPRCRRKLDTMGDASACAGCGHDLAMQLPPPFIEKTHRTIVRTFLGAPDSEQTSPTEVVKRWYVVCDVDPSRVEADRQRAASALALLESKLPRASWPAPRVSPPSKERAEDVPQLPMMSGGPYRGKPVRQAPEADAPVASGQRATLPRNLALVLMGLLALLGWLLGYWSHP